MGRKPKWDPVVGRLDLSASQDAGILQIKDRLLRSWPSSTIDRVGPANVKELIIDGHKLSAVPGDELAKLINLEVLDLSMNRIDSLPAQLGKLTNLKTLIVSNNPLRCLPGEIACCVSLVELRAVNCALLTVPAELGQLFNLEALFISGNQLQDLPLEISRLPKLNVDNFRFSVLPNPLSALPPSLQLSDSVSGTSKWAAEQAILAHLRGAAEVAPASHLKPLVGAGWIPKHGRLDLYGRGLTAWPVREIERAGPANIKQLDLRRNGIKEIPEGALEKLVNLQDLWLDGNQLSVLPDEVCALQRLEWLSVAGNLLNDVPVELGLCPRLAAGHASFARNPLEALPVSVRTAASERDRDAAILDHVRAAARLIRRKPVSATALRGSSSFDRSSLDRSSLDRFSLESAASSASFAPPASLAPPLLARGAASAPATARCPPPPAARPAPSADLLDLFSPVPSAAAAALPPRAPHAPPFPAAGAPHAHAAPPQWWQPGSSQPPALVAAAPALYFPVPNLAAAFPAPAAAPAYQPAPFPNLDAWNPFADDGPPSPPPAASTNPFEAAGVCWERPVALAA